MTISLLPISYDAVPKEGERSIWLGKIAGTDVNAYFDMDKLMRHALIAGGPSVGKTHAAMVIAEECLMKNIPVVVFEPYVRWTGFAKPCTNREMLDLYPKFGLDKKSARAFPTNIIEIIDPHLEVDILKFVKDGEITVFVLDKLTPNSYNKFFEKNILDLFFGREEYRELRMLMIFEDAYRLLPAFGGGGAIVLERACRELRKWGFGLVIVTHLFSDFDVSVIGNLETDIMMSTVYDKDVMLAQERWGSMEHGRAIATLGVGKALIQNRAFNYTKPWAIEFRPLLHQSGKMSDREIKNAKMPYF